MKPKDQMIKQTAVVVLSMAVCELFPEAKLLKSHVTGIGFASDFLINQPLESPHIPLIEEKMREIGKRNIPIETIEMIPKNAKELFRYHSQPLLADQIEESPITISLLRIGEFYDLYANPLNLNTSEIGFIAIESIEKLQNRTFRIHGTCSSDKKQLKEFLKRKEKTKLWDHTLIGNSLNLFSFSKDQNILWHPGGAELRCILINWLEKEHQKLSYQILYTPPFEPIQHDEMYKKHLGTRFYEWIFQLNQTRSYPFFRGLLTGSIETSDRGTLFCSQKEAIQEFTSLLQFIKKIIKLLAFEHHWCLITADRQILGEFPLIEESFKGAAKFRIEVRIHDALGQDWLGPWIEWDGRKETAVIKHSLTGSIERLIALLIETHQGELPIWLKPEHVRIIAVNKWNVPYVQRIIRELDEAGLRSRFDDRDLMVGQRVSAALSEKVPFIVVVGDKEEKTECVTIRQDDKTGITKPKTAFIEEIADKIKERV